MLQKILGKLQQLCAAAAAQLDKLCSINDAQKEYTVLCDEDGNPFLQQLCIATGEVSVLNIDGTSNDQTCVTVTRLCTSVVSSLVLTDTLTSIEVAGDSNAVPADWATLDAQLRASWFEGLLPAGYDYDTTTGRLCAEDGGAALSLVARYDRLGRLFAWSSQTFQQCTGGTQPVGELAPCIEPNEDYTTTLTQACDSVLGDIDIVKVYLNGVLQSEVYTVVETGAVVTELNEVTAGYCSNSDALLEKACETAENTALTLDCLCNDACAVPLVGPLAKGEGETTGTYSVAADSGETFVVGQNVAFYNEAGDIVGNAVISGAATTDAAGNMVYPISGCTVAADDVAAVTTVKAVLEVAKAAVAAKAVKFAQRAKVAIKTETKGEATAVEPEAPVLESAEAQTRDTLTRG